MSNMMRNYHVFTGGGQYWLFSVVSILGIISCTIVIVGAAMLRARPQDRFIWGILIPIFAIVSIADMGGYFIGAILSIIGGALALSHRSLAPQNPPK